MQFPSLYFYKYLILSFFMPLIDIILFEMVHIFVTIVNMYIFLVSFSTINFFLSFKIIIQILILLRKLL